MRLGRTGGRRRAEVQIAPLIDVVFLLLIFYAVTTQFVSDERLRLELPEARTAEDAGLRRQQEPPTVTVSAGGEIFLGEREVAPERLEAELAAALEAVSERSVIVKGDRTADYGTVVTVLDTARALGATTVQMSATRPAGEGS